MARPKLPRDLETIRRVEVGQLARVANVWLTKSQILHELQQICPAALRLLPHILSFPSDLIDSKWDGQLHPAYQIGHLWMDRPSMTSDGTEKVHENLIAVDIGALRHELPQLVCYVMGGADCVQAVIKADGFKGEGILQDFIHHGGGTRSRFHLKINDPMVTNLIQFIQVVRGHRAYYALNVSEGLPVPAQLASLTQAIFIATSRARHGHQVIAAIEASRPAPSTEANSPVPSIEAPSPDNGPRLKMPQSRTKRQLRAKAEPRAKIGQGVRKHQVKPNQFGAITIINNGIKLNEATADMVRPLGATNDPVRAASESTVTSLDSPARDSPIQSEDKKSDDKNTPQTTDHSSSPEES